MVPRKALAVTVALTLGLLAACSDDEPTTEADRSSTTSIAEATTSTEAAPSASLVAEASEQTIDIYDEVDGEVARTLDRADETSKKLVFLVKARKNDWLEVYLPVRPNGSTGWVRSDAVSLSQHHFRIEIRLEAHRIKVFNKDAVIMDEPIGVGTGNTPTPGGVFYLKELLKPPNPNGVYGTYAYGLSGFSNVLTTFNGGDGVIGLHGTNDPAAIGTDVSHGCIRMRNEAISKLAEVVGLPLGTPVEIIA